MRHSLRKPHLMAKLRARDYMTCHLQLCRQAPSLLQAPNIRRSSGNLVSLAAALLGDRCWEYLLWARSDQADSDDVELWDLGGLV
jgi:hypothetical protein